MSNTDFLRPKQNWIEYMGLGLALVLAWGLGELVARNSWLVLGSLICVATVVAFPSRWILVGLVIVAQIEPLNLSLLSVGRLNIRATDITMILLLVRVIMESQARIRLVPGHILIVIAMLGFLPGLVSAVIMFDPGLVATQIVAFGRFMTSVVAAFVLPTVLSSKQEVRRFFVIFALIALLHGVFGLYTFLSGVTRAQGFTSVADLGLLMAVVSVVALALDSHRSSIYGKMCFAISSVCLAATVSKAALIAYVFAVLVVIVSRMKFRHLIAAVGTIAMGALIFPGVRISIVETVASSFTERTAFVTAALRLGMQKPIFGSGWSSFRFFSDTVLREFWYELSTVVNVTETHSGYAQFFFDGGILGLGVFLVLQIGLIIVLRRVRSSDDPFLRLAAATGFPVAVLFAVWLGLNQILPGTFSTLVFWIYVGGVLALDGIDRNEPKVRMGV